MTCCGELEHNQAFLVQNLFVSRVEPQLSTGKKFENRKFRGQKVRHCQVIKLAEFKSSKLCNLRGRNCSICPTGQKLNIPPQICGEKTVKKARPICKFAGSKVQLSHTKLKTVVSRVQKVRQGPNHQIEFKLLGSWNYGTKIAEPKLWNRRAKNSSNFNKKWRQRWDLNPRGQSPST